MAGKTPQKPAETSVAKTPVAAKPEKPAVTPAPTARSCRRCGRVSSSAVRWRRISLPGAKLPLQISKSMRTQDHRKNHRTGRTRGRICRVGLEKNTELYVYYHFTMPEAKYQELVTFLSTYGKSKIGGEKHPRVMPDGIIRMIITVDEAQK